MMTARTCGMIIISLLVSACGQPNQITRGSDTPANGLSFATQGSAVVQQALTAPEDAIYMQAKYDVQDVRIVVPSGLTSSEANVFYPLADIVWRGEPLANRHEQVRQIFRDASAAATGAMNTGPGVIVQIEVTRFHSVTEKTRYTVGGVHSMHFTLTVTDAQTGAVIDGPRAVIADTPAVGGVRAIAQDQAGMTQRVVVLDRLKYVLQRELSAPASDTVVARAIAARAQTVTPIALN
jgi:hypothetical protein